MSNVKKMVFTALLIALGVLLPIALHSVPNAAFVLLPMHVPVLMCGIICGFSYGLACGILTPIVSSLLTGMPPMAILPSMICELAVYGLIAGLIMNFIKTKNIYIKVYISLIGSMICGRIIFGLLNAFIFKAGDYSVQVWVAAAFVTALPGVLIQLVLIPAIVIALQKAKLIEI